MLSHKYKCIFIHIPKTAGTSISKKLDLIDDLKRGVQDHRTIKDIQPLPQIPFMKQIRAGNLYLLIREVKNILKGRFRTPQNLYENYLKFSFVRNPWDRTFSWYKNLMRDDILRKNERVPPNCTFQEYILNHLNSSWALQSQLHWLTDFQGKIPLDFIGKFETLEEDFSRLSNLLNLQNSTLPRLLSSNEDHYPDFHTELTRRLIAEKYKKEIEYFDYTFGT